MKIATTAFLFAALIASHCTPCASETLRIDSPSANGVSTRSLVVQANEAFRRGAFVSPAGDNALELLIAARDLDPSDRSVEVALLELFPIALAAADAHVAAGRRSEAARIVVLIDRAVPNSTTVARLRRQLHVPGEVTVALASSSVATQTP
jgi:hypothetical protein